MGQVVQMNFPFRQTSRETRVAQLVQCFAEERRKQSDVFWLKENAEMLNILESTGVDISPGTLDPLVPFQENLNQRLSFFPQYYRFLLSIALDLEDLGMGSDTAEQSVAWVVQQGLAETELSDLQRAEARRLCLRRNVDPVAGDAGLDDRLRDFGCRTHTFTLPNKKAAYELTHIVFYLSEYGRKNPDLPKPFIDSLHFAGTLAFLELNIDLLSEVCIALRFASQTPPETWEQWLRGQTRQFVCEPGAPGWGSDDYHPFLMCNWFSLVAGLGGFGLSVPDTTFSFCAPRATATPLRELSESIYNLATSRSSDWQTMREKIADTLTYETQEVLVAAESAVDFDRFFSGFARADMPRPTLREAQA